MNHSALEYCGGCPPPYSDSSDGAAGGRGGWRKKQDGCHLPKADHENVITVYGGTEPWKQRLEVKAKDSAYLVIVDQNGKVAWRHAGPFEKTSYQGLAVQVRQLASAQ